MALRLHAVDLRIGVRALFRTSALSDASASSDPCVKPFRIEGQITGNRPELGLFKKINELVRRRKWNSLEHKPVRFLFGEEAREPYAVYEHIYNHKHHRYSERWANGKEIELVLRFVFAFLLLVSIFQGYNYFVPEKYRYKYKYGIKQQLEEKAKRGDHSHH